MMETNAASYDSVLPPYPEWTGQKPQYPHAMGFVYVAAEFEQCVYKKGCTELPELPLEEQRLIVQMTGRVLQGIGAYKGVTGI